MATMLATMESGPSSRSSRRQVCTGSEGRLSLDRQAVLVRPRLGHNRLNIHTYQKLEAGTLTSLAVWSVQRPSHRRCSTKTTPAQGCKRRRAVCEYSGNDQTLKLIINNKMIIAFQGAIRDFYNLLSAPRTVSNTYAQVARAQSCANDVQHIEHLSRTTCRVTRHVVRKDSLAIKFDRV